MIPESKIPIKMAGYLEKKSKMRVVCRWKKLWFVLEGRLLLYYKSQLEYLSLSPCRGTVNMGLAASVFPGASQEIVVSTRSHTVFLRALNRTDHDVWLQALIDAMYLPNTSHSRCCSKPLHHFRYATGIGEQLTGHENPYKIPVPSDTSPVTTPIYPKAATVKGGSLASNVKAKRNERSEYGKIEPRSEKNPRNDQTYLRKGDLMLKKPSKVALSDTSIPGRFKMSSQEISNNKFIRRSFSAEDEVNRFGENIYESLKSVDKYENKRSNKNQVKKNIRLNRSDSDCLMSTPREKLLKNMHYISSERKKRDIQGDLKAFTLGTRERKFTSERRLSSINDEQWTLLGWSPGYGNKVRSDTDLTVPRSRRLLQNENLSSSYDFANLRELIREKTNAPIPLPRTLNKRSNSILRHFSPQASSNPYVSRSTDGRRMSVKKRSLSFLKKIWCRRESNKWEPGSTPCRTRHFVQDIDALDSDLEVLSDFSDSDLTIMYKQRPEPPPDYDNINISDEEILPRMDRKQIPNLPPRFKTEDNQEDWHKIRRSCSPWHGVTKGSKTIESTQPPDHCDIDGSWSLEAPELPPKTSLCIANARDLLSQNTDNGLIRLFSEDSPKIIAEVRKDTKAKPINRKKEELTEILENLMALNSCPLFHTSLYQNTQEIYEETKKLKKTQEIKEENEDPDYDIPRPHVSLLPYIKQQNPTVSSDSMEPTRFFTGHYEDSLDVAAVREPKEEITMAPDSLECDPWLMNEDIKIIEDPWVYQGSSLPRHPLTIDSLYQDSLNPTAVVSADFTQRSEYIHTTHNLKIS